MVERIHELWALGQGDDDIAAQLTQEGFHSARSVGVSPVAVMKIRLEHKWYLALHQSRNVDELSGYLTVTGLARQVGVDRSWVYRRLERGQIEAQYYTRHPQSGTYLIVNDPELIASLRPALKRKSHS
jgi:hypothetical protein